MSVPAEIGPYEIQREIGRGGMGVVYLGRDPKLDRDVAVKALPQDVAGDPERLERFQREAKLLASLHHSNIAGVYGLEEVDGAQYLVLEYVEGETLAERLLRGPLPVEDALSMARQITEAVEAAHAKGVIHRDLKPANIKITPDGQVKVLDFGLAKALGGEAASGDPTESPTLTAMATRRGVILGTAGYMSPEQARGKAVDKRCDVWSFGCVLYEMLTGAEPFGGETATDSLGAILHKAPQWQALPADTPPTVHLLLRHCLTKDRNRRLHDIADARIQLEDMLTGGTDEWPTAALPRSVRPRLWRSVVPWVVVAVLVVVAAFAVWWPRGVAIAPGPVMRLTVALPTSDHLDWRGNIAISPDGRRLVYTGKHGNATYLYLRHLDDERPVRLEGTEDGYTPFFSPDGEWVGFIPQQEEAVKKVSLRGGAPVTICGEAWFGGCWCPDDTIIFTRHAYDLARVPAAGGTPEPITTLDIDRGEFAHLWPYPLPGGKAILFTIWTTSVKDARIAVLSLETGEVRTLLVGGSDARYVKTGHLVYTWEHGLMGVPFDLERLEVRGTPVPIHQDVLIQPTSGGAQFCVSADGTAAFVPADTAARRLVWVDRSGNVEPVVDVRRAYSEPNLSPDGQRAAVVITEGAEFDVWGLDLSRDTLSRLTYDGTSNTPCWTPDSRHITFCSMREGPFDLYRVPADGSGDAEVLLAGPHDKSPLSWSPDGRTLVYSEDVPGGIGDLMLLAVEGDRAPRPFLETPFAEDRARYSPDGRWVAYQSDESGRFQIYVRPAAGGRAWQASVAGGTEPVWSPDGRELFFRDGDRMLSVPVTTGTDFHSGTPTLLFEGRFESEYDVHPDGQRFMMVQPDPEAMTHIKVVLNWFEEIKRLAPPGDDR